MTSGIALQRKSVGNNSTFFVVLHIRAIYRSLQMRRTAIYSCFYSLFTEKNISLRVFIRTYCIGLSQSH